MFSPSGYRERKARRFTTESSTADHLHSTANGGRLQHIVLLNATLVTDGVAGLTPCVRLAAARK
jgi:hypothetical protein